MSEDAVNEMSFEGRGYFRNVGDKSGQLATMRVETTDQIASLGYIAVRILEARGYAVDQPGPCETGFHLFPEQALELASWLQDVAKPSA